jgi:hypothetical protein
MHANAFTYMPALCMNVVYSEIDTHGKITGFMTAKQGEHKSLFDRLVEEVLCKRIFPFQTKRCQHSIPSNLSIKCALFTGAFTERSV